MIHGKGVFGRLKVTFVKQCKEEEKSEEHGAIFRNTFHELPSSFLSNLVCRVMYMESIKYENLIQISIVVIDIRGVENGELAVPVNNTLVCHTAFLAANT